jgi:hypothetical protein
MNQLIHCVACHAVFMKTPFDQEPEYNEPSFSSSDTVQPTERDDFKEFMKDHEGHPLEDLTIVEESCVSEKNYIEPVKVSYFRATNGKEKFVIKRFREKIEEPLRYEFVAGDYSLKCVRLEVQARDIERQMAVEYKAAPFPKNKIDSFIRLYDHIVKTVEVGNLERVREESCNPLEVYFKVDDLSLMYLLRNCHHIFRGQAYSSIEKFINRHKDDGVLLLKATYRLEVTEQPKSKEKPFFSALPLDKTKIGEMI